MKVYDRLPCTEYRCTSWSYVDRVTHLRARKQTAFNQIVVARIEIVRFVVFSAIELGAHVVAGTVKFAVAAIPLRVIRQGITPRVALLDARRHLERSLALSITLLAVPLLGLARPEWSIKVCQKMLTGLPPARRMARVMHRINSLWIRHRFTVGVVLATNCLMIVALMRSVNHAIEDLFNGRVLLSEKLLFVCLCMFTGMMVVIMRQTAELQRLRIFEEVAHQQREAGWHTGGTPITRATQNEVLVARAFMKLEPNASLEEINSKFREMALHGECSHPDKGGNEAKFKELNRCVNILRENQ